MDALALIALVGLLSKEELRFSAAYEQAAEATCGLAAAASLLGLYCGQAVGEVELAAAADAEGGLDAGNLGGLLRLATAAGFRARAYKIRRSELDEALSRDLAPILLHYDRPRGHFALLLGQAEGGYVTADPARGLERLSAAELERRWSGAALVLPPGSVNAAGRALRDASMTRTAGRWRLLRPEPTPRAPRADAGLGVESGRVETAPRPLGAPSPSTIQPVDAPAASSREGTGLPPAEGAPPRPEPGEANSAVPPPRGKPARRSRIAPALRGGSLLLGLDAGLLASSAAPILQGSLSSSLHFPGGLGFGLELPWSSAWEGGLWLARIEGLGASLSWRSLWADCFLESHLGAELPADIFVPGRSLAEAGCRLRLGLDAALVIDPACLSGSVEASRSISGVTGPRWELDLGLSASEAINDRLSLGLSLGLSLWPGADQPEARLALGCSLGLALGRAGLRVGVSRASAGSETARLGLSYRLGGEN